MSYCKWNEYVIKPKEAYRFLKNCSGCGCKSSFVSTGCYRVNANGNRVDVWLIYQCEKCRHTYNLTIYERVKPSELEQEEYESYLANDSELAMKNGMDKNLLARNKVEIDWDRAACEIQALHETEQYPTQIMIQNPYDFKVRMDKLLSGILKLSRSDIKELIKKEVIVPVTDQAKHTITVLIKNNEITG